MVQSKNILEFKAKPCTFLDLKISRNTDLGSSWLLLRDMPQLRAGKVQGQCAQSQSRLGGSGQIGSTSDFIIAVQDANMNKTGQFRFTPPTHALLAFKRALQEYHGEGALEGRMTR